VFHTHNLGVGPWLDAFFMSAAAEDQDRRQGRFCPWVRFAGFAPNHTPSNYFTLSMVKFTPL
jgi:hypothetical protein